MTTYRLNKVFQNIGENNIFFLPDNDIFCDSKLRITNIDFQIFRFFSEKYRVAFINDNNVNFLDELSFNSFCNFEKITLKGSLESLKLVEFKKNKLLIQKIFTKQFINNLKYFINENKNSVYVISSNNENMSRIIDLFNRQILNDNILIIKFTDMQLLKQLLWNNNINCIIDSLKPESDELFNILELLRIKNNIKFNSDYIKKETQINNLLDFYESLKEIKNKDITDIIIEFNNKESRQEKINWLEF